MKPAFISQSGKCCRYNYCIIVNFSAHEAIINTKELFDQSWNIFAYNSKKNLIPKGVTIENSWLYHDLILFSGLNTKMNDWNWKVKWDEIGAWHYFFYPRAFPFDIEPNETMHQRILPLIDSEGLTSYFNLDKDWKFIHEVGADLTIVKQGDNVLIAALDKSTIQKFKYVMDRFKLYNGFLF